MALTQEQVLAFAVYEIRLLLASHLGSGNQSDLSIRAAAHLAYALHNQADAVLQGGTFDPQMATEGRLNFQVQHPHINQPEAGKRGSVLRWDTAI